VIGKDTLPLAYDAEIPAVIYGIFHELAFGPFTIYVNNRKLLRGLFESLGFATDKHEHILHEIDRIGKQDPSDIQARLVDGPNLMTNGPDPKEQQESVLTLFWLIGAEEKRASSATFEALRRFDRPNPTFTEGLDELQRVYDGTLALGVPERALQLNLAIVRGLDYYTGTIYETLLDDHPRLGSICSGGRYDNLAGHYTKSKLPGVGISIGATRLFSQLLEVGVIATARGAVADVLVLNVEPALSQGYAELATKLRDAGLNVEVYFGDEKLGKQLKYADRSKIPLALIYGTREKEQGVVNVKELLETVSTKQHVVPLADLVPVIKRLLGK
jgi:histidyl-tRNA synthetase